METVIQTISKYHFHRIYVLEDQTKELTSILTLTDILQELMATR